MSHAKCEGTSNVNGTRLHISTVVFLVIESTGLTRPRTTELCMIAVNKHDLEGSTSFPRVLNKLLVCLDPKKPIDHGASFITGLYNDSLEHQSPFDVHTVNLIHSFLNHLTKPICLVSHNGKIFAFPLLLSELKRVNKSLDCDLYCADSLEAIRELDGLPRKFDINDHNENNANNSVLSTVSTSRAEVVASKSQLWKQKLGDSGKGRENCSPHDKVRKTLDFGGEERKDKTEGTDISDENEHWSQSLEDSDYLCLDIDTNSTTGDRDGSALAEWKNDNTEHMQSPRSRNSVGSSQDSEYIFVGKTMEDFSPDSSYSSSGFLHIGHAGISMLNQDETLNLDEPLESMLNTQDIETGHGVCGIEIANPVNNSNVVAGISGCAKQIEICSTSSAAVVSVKRKSYKLAEVYFRTFGKYPEITHSAEADCIALMKITTQTPRLLEWIETYAFLLISIQAK